MIQRIQSIWLFLAALTLVLMLFLPIATKTVDGSEAKIYTNGLHHYVEGKTGKVLNIEVTLPLLISNIVVALICFLNIFNYKKRSFQKRFAIVSIILVGGFAFWCSIYAKELPGGIEGASFGVGAYLPALAILFIVLAIFGINKDERLIRSAERLR
ncbi:DUF4293 domain-containing protein [Pedobacter zeae]|uniref:Glucan phosphoethanolaminetransferase (Alkaline phosphatase superfamily) n=2 Tax=Pedobacter zeae TaxID=1737356 RepID=A0A7W6P7R9_9SPHI|nr:DUF4293 domain-containing protein [Pedobacter zeae]MBB4110527.1 glucan phosphoethanolaminetransferase (alkaline phosphatase superfamily) [Pedobacter zeae]